MAIPNSDPEPSKTEQSDNPVDNDFLAELNRRAAEILNGTEKGSPASDVFERLERKYSKSNP